MESSLLAGLRELSIEELQHLSLDTDSFINALRRFLSRRGLVRLLVHLVAMSSRGL